MDNLDIYSFNAGQNNTDAGDELKAAHSIHESPDVDQRSTIGRTRAGQKQQGETQRVSCSRIPPRPTS